MGRNQEVAGMSLSKVVCKAGVCGRESDEFSTAVACAVGRL